MIAPNMPAMYEAHFGVPMTGAVLNTLNIRLDAEAIAFQLAHGEAKVLITDREFSATIQRALSMLERRPLVIDIDDPCTRRHAARRDGLRSVPREGDPDFAWPYPGRRVRPHCAELHVGHDRQSQRGGHHHRGAYLNASSQHRSPGACRRTRSISGRCRCSIATAGAFPGRWRRTPGPTSAPGGSSEADLRGDRQHGVTHMCGAPIVYNMLINAPPRLRAAVPHKVSGYIAGPPRPLPRSRAGAHGVRHHACVRADGNLWPASVCARRRNGSSLPSEPNAPG